MNQTNGVHPVGDCYICQRYEPLFFHATTATVVDRAQCRRQEGEGVWVCPICEEALHRWIRDNRSRYANANAVAVDVMFHRLSKALLKPTRKYRRTAQHRDERRQSI